MTARPMSGESWVRLWRQLGEPDLDVRAVECRVCSAPMGVYCRRPSGHKAMSPHALRWDDALRAYALAVAA